MKSAFRVFAGTLFVAGTFSLVKPQVAAAQWSRVYDQFYLPGKFNWAFRKNYPSADALFNAFDYGHAILYERLYKEQGAPESLLEEKEYNFITRKLLVHPPKLPLEEGAIEIDYARIAPEAKAMLDWAHQLHRQIYDVWSDDRLSPADKDAKVADLIRYYKSRPDLAFSSQPKAMELMEAQYYSTDFRRRYPKFNGLIWAYHWLQIGLYEPLLTASSKDARQTAVLSAVARFRQMIENAPTNMPRVMPMTAAVAPTFAARYPEAAIIFDNLHSMHDVISDILASPKVPSSRKRAEILLAAARYRDDDTMIMTHSEWIDMAGMMGLNNMGGSPINFLAAFPTPTVARGALSTELGHSMAGMANMTGDSTHNARMDSSKVPMQGMKMDTAAMPGMDHSTMQMGSMGAMSSPADLMTEMAMRMMGDEVIRDRVAGDTVLTRMMNQVVAMMPEAHRPMMEMMMRPSGRKATGSAAPARKAKTSATATSKSSSSSKTVARKSAPKTSPAKKQASKPAAKPAAKPAPMPMDHSNMPGMVMPPKKKQ